MLAIIGDFASVTLGFDKENLAVAIDHEMVYVTILGSDVVEYGKLSLG